MHEVLSLPLQHDQDVVHARQAAAEIARLLGFDTPDQTRIATAVSEIVRNAVRYAGLGRVTFEIHEDANRPVFVARVADQGPGIAALEDVLAGRYESTTGLGIGVAGARRLTDVFEITSSKAGTTVTLGRYLPTSARALTSERIRAIAAAAEARHEGVLGEAFQQQNQELLRALDELQRKQAELLRLNGELDETNRGVVALCAELDERADHLRLAGEAKSRFLSNMTHELRTPVNSILGLCNLLVDSCTERGREPDQEIVYIRKAAEQLSELVNDLLDLAKTEAGKSDVRVTEFEVDKLFAVLRGMLRPLLGNPSIALIFEDVSHIPPLRTDEAKTSQILRNLISNALKFTERGEVRVSASLDADGRIDFLVSDTGIGIAREDQTRVFEEFVQIEHSLQRRVHGTGLGLSLSKRLAELLGGTLSVRSRVGAGSVFRLNLPMAYEAPIVEDAERAEAPLAGLAVRVLVIDDDDASRFLIRQCLPGSPLEVIETDCGSEGIRLAIEDLPDLIVLDLVLPDVDGREVMAQLRASARTCDIPVIIVTSTTLDAPDGRALLADAFAVITKDALTRKTLCDAVSAALNRRNPAA